MATFSENIRPTFFESVGSIRVESVTKAPAQQSALEKKGEIYGGYGYSANVSANNGEGFTIILNVVSKDGKYTILRKDLNATKTGAKNITVGNFTFYNFYLVSYGIQKTKDSSILTLVYKDKSIFMDKLYIGRLGYEYFKQDQHLQTLLRSASFQMNCGDELKPEFKNASILRYLSNVYTNPLTDDVSGYDYLQSKYFYSRYNYDKDSVNGGNIILGIEEFREELCHLAETSYSLRDLFSALHYSGIPGLKDFTLPDNVIYKKVRRSYSGVLRRVLDQWGADFSYKFYFQPKITYVEKNYSTGNTETKTISEGLKFFDFNSENTLDNLTNFLNGNTSIHEVIGEITESASLEGTTKNSVITPIRIDAKVFDTQQNYKQRRTSAAISSDELPALFGVSFNKYLGILGVYDENLRNIYAANAENYAALGIIGTPINLATQITQNIDFLRNFGPELGSSPSDLLNNYIILLCQYDPARHKMIMDWEKEVMTNFYGQYHLLTINDNISNCGTYGNYTVNYSTEPSSELYSRNELPFKNLLFGNFASTNANQKYRIMQVQNPLDARNSAAYKAYSDSFGNNATTNFQARSACSFISLYNNAGAISALGAALNNQINFVNIANNIYSYIVVIPKWSRLNTTVSTGTDTNTSVSTTSDYTNSTNNSRSTNCGKTLCKENLVSLTCGVDNSNNNNNSVAVGFVGKACDYISLDGNILRFQCKSDYQYAIEADTSSTITFASNIKILGDLPIIGGDGNLGNISSNQNNNFFENNVLSCDVLINRIPEVLTQSTFIAGTQTKVIDYTENASGGIEGIVTSPEQFHSVAARQLNNSVTLPQESKYIKLNSVNIPDVFVDYIFDNPILSSINFSLSETGFETALNFQNRPSIKKPLETIIDQRSLFDPF